MADSRAEISKTDDLMNHQAECCFHCQERMPRFTGITAVVDGVQQPMCCVGCKSAAEFISQQGLTRFYEHRERDSHRNAAVARDKASLDYWSFIDEPETREKYCVVTANGELRVTISVPGMYCSSCTWLISKSLAAVAESVRVTSDTASKRITLRWHQRDDSADLLSRLLTTIHSLGYQPKPLQRGQLFSTQSQVNSEHDRSLKRIAVAGLGMMQVMTYAVATYVGASDQIGGQYLRFFELLSLLIATVVVMYSGSQFFENAINDLRHRHLGMDVPIALAIAGAYFPSVAITLFELDAPVYFDSAVMFVFFLLVGRHIEMRARHRLQSSSTALSELLPDHVSVNRVDDQQTMKLKELKISPADVKKDDIISLQAGEVVPFDIMITQGTAQMDESLLTGEALPQQKVAGQIALAGVRLVAGQIEAKACYDWSENSILKLQAMLHANPDDVQSAAAQSFGQHFVKAVLLFTFVVASLWLWFAPERVFEITLAMLIATCPCAFALALPVSNTVACHALSRLGVLVAKPSALLALPAAQTWCFDKTGTLTQGKPSVVNVHCLSSTSQVACLELIASLEAGSYHPLAAAFRGVSTPHTVTEFTEVSGSGVSGVINGKRYYVGSRDWVGAQISNSLDCEQTTDSELILASEGEILCSVSVQDQMRLDTSHLLSYLHSKGKRLVLISGDHLSAVNDFAKSLPFDETHGAVSPQQKIDVVSEIQAQGQQVVMVGDGSNDAPVLNQADISIALASGSQLSQSQADVILLNKKLSSLEALLLAANKMISVTHQNLAWALVYNAIALSLAAVGFLTPWLAALGMSLSSLLVVVNASRIGKSVQPSSGLSSTRLEA
jgi:Cu2+-exporting ATPase